MIGIANHHMAPVVLKLQRQRSQAFLIVPGEDLGVVFDETIIAMRYGVGGIEINEIARADALHRLLEVSMQHVGTLQGGTDFPESVGIIRLDVSLVTVRDIELAAQVLPVNSIERQGA